MLKISDQVFSIIESEFSAGISLEKKGPSVWWSFDFRAAKREIDGLPWEPHLSSHGLIRLPQLSAIAGSEIMLADDPDEEPAFILYVYDHQPIYKSRIKFGSWQDGKIGFTFSGRTDLYIDEKYKDNLPVLLECALVFQGVTVLTTNLTEAEQVFGQFFQREQFKSGVPVTGNQLIFFEFSDKYA
jgi:hypothetical protein